MRNKHSQKSIAGYQEQAIPSIIVLLWLDSEVTFYKTLNYLFYPAHYNID